MQNQAGRIENPDSRFQIPDSRATRAGFTLIELIVSMTIFTVISAFVLVNFRQGQRQDEVRFGAEIAAAVIRDALARGTAGATVPICVKGAELAGVCQGSPPACPGGVCVSSVPKGWGVSFGTGKPDAITLFADTNGNGALDPGEEVVVEKYSLSGLVQVTAAAPTSAQTSIVFVPPIPEVRINGGTADTQASFTIAHGAGGALQRTVTFNRISRRIEITNP